MAKSSTKSKAAQFNLSSLELQSLDLQELCCNLQISVASLQGMLCQLRVVASVQTFYAPPGRH